MFLARRGVKCSKILPVWASRPSPQWAKHPSRARRGPRRRSGQQRVKRRGIYPKAQSVRTAAWSTHALRVVPRHEAHHHDDAPHFTRCSLPPPKTHGAGRLLRRIESKNGASRLLSGAEEPPLKKQTTQVGTQKRWNPGPCAQGNEPPSFSATVQPRHRKTLAHCTRTPHHHSRPESRWRQRCHPSQRAHVILMTCHSPTAGS